MAPRVRAAATQLVAFELYALTHEDMRIRAARFNAVTYESMEAWASALGGPRALYEALVRFINSPQVQEVWAPSFGASRELHVTFDALLAHAKPNQT